MGFCLSQSPLPPFIFIRHLSNLNPLELTYKIISKSPIDELVIVIIYDLVIVIIYRIIGFEMNKLVGA